MEIVWILIHLLIIRKLIQFNSSSNSNQHRCVERGSRLYLASQICHGLVLSSDPNQLSRNVLKSLLGWWNTQHTFKFPLFDLDDINPNSSSKKKINIPINNVREWVAWAFFDKRLQDIISINDLRELDLIIIYFQTKLSMQFSNIDYDPLIKPIRLNIDPVLTIYKPLFIYLILKISDWYLDNSILNLGYKSYKISMDHPHIVHGLYPCSTCISNDLNDNRNFNKKNPYNYPLFPNMNMSHISNKSNLPIKLLDLKIQITQNSFDYNSLLNYFKDLYHNSLSCIAPFSFDRDIKLDFFFKPANPKLKQSRFPLIFIHGIGLGTSQNYLFLKSIPDNIPIFVIKFPEFTLRSTFVKEPNSISENCKAIEVLLHRYGFNEGVFVGHSIGSIVISWLSTNNPTLVASTIFLDPICFLLYHYAVAKNFIYAKSSNQMFYKFIRYFVARDINVSHYLGRHFNWSCNTMMWKDLPKKPYSHNLILVCNNDSIIPVDQISRYVIHSMVEDMVAEDEERLSKKKKADTKEEEKEEEEYKNEYEEFYEEERLDLNGKWKETIRLSFDINKDGETIVRKSGKNLVYNDCTIKDYHPLTFDGLKSKNEKKIGSINKKKIIFKDDDFKLNIYDDNYLLNKEDKDQCDAILFNRKDPLKSNGTNSFIYCFNKKHGEILMDMNVTKLAIDAIQKACM